MPIGTEEGENQSYVLFFTDCTHRYRGGVGERLSSPAEIVSCSFLAVRVKMSPEIHGSKTTQ